MRHYFPDHQEQLNRLSKIDGQIKGVRKMIEERRYCVDIVAQIRAVKGALRQVEMGVLERHIHHCVKDAAVSGEGEAMESKMEELVRLFDQMA